MSLQNYKNYFQKLLSKYVNRNLLSIYSTRFNPVICLTHLDLDKKSLEEKSLATLSFIIVYLIVKTN